MSIIQTLNPATGKPLKSFAHASHREIETALDRAVKAQKIWKQSSLVERSRGLEKLAQLLRENAMELANKMHQEMGKTLKEGMSEVEKCAFSLEHFAKSLENFPRHKFVQEEKLKAEIRLESLGLVFAIMPWNFPLWQTVRAFLPNVAVGNAFLLKPSDLVPDTTELFSELVQRCFPEGVYQHLLLDHDQAAEVIRDARVRAVTMTGSSRGGREIAKVAGENLKKVVLELGGSDPYLILEDADLAKSADLCAQSRMINSGQSCICAKRFLVPQSKLQEWLGYFKNRLEQLSKEAGPLAHPKFKRQLQEQLEKVRAQGGTLHWRGETPAGDHAFMAPEIWLITGKEEFHKTEEFFGPVALVIPYTNLEQALELANGTIYGLGGAVFGRDEEKAKEVGLKLDCGLLAINDFNKSDVRLPFGGVRSSGFGRELGPWPLFEFANLRALTGL